MGRLASGVAQLGLTLLVVAITARQLGDFDLPMHLLNGRVMWQTDRLPHVDDFSYLHGTVRYVEVVSVSLFHAAMAVGGTRGLQLVGGLSAASLAVAVWLQTRRFGPAGLLVTSLVVASTSTFLVVRSSALSFPLLAWSLWALDTHRREGATRAGRRALGIWVALMFVWANTHGSVTLGLVVGAAYAAHAFACRVAGPRSQRLLPEDEGRDARAAGLAWLMGVAVASVNPAGPALLPGPLRFGGKMAVLATFSEWARPSWSFFTDHEPVLLGVLGAAVVAAMFGRDEDSRARTPALFDFAVFVLAMACASTAVRLVPLAAILLAPWIARRTARWVPTLRPTWLAAAGSTLLVSARAVASPVPLGAGFDTGHLPEGAVRWIEAHPVEGAMWNPAPFGAYLAMRLYPRHRVLVDGRNALAYDLADIAEADSSEQDPTAFGALVRKHDITWGVTRAFEGVPAGIPLAVASKDWTMVFLDDVSAVYVRRDGPNASLAAHGYRVLRHLATPSQVLAMAVEGGPGAPDLAHDGGLALEQAPSSPRSVFYFACGALALRDAPTFRLATQRLGTVAPGHPALGVLERAWATVVALPPTPAPPAPSAAPAPSGE